MATLEKVKTGQRFRPKVEEWNAFIDAARYIRDRALSQHAEADSSEDETTSFRNEADSDIPMFGVGWLTDAVFQGLSVVKQPPHSIISRLIIASRPCEAGGVGAGWTSGIRPVRVTDWEGIAVDDRIGPQPGSWEARLDPLGPMTVIGKLDSPFVAALITLRRGDHVYVDTGSATTRGPKQYIQWGIGYAVSETIPGVPEVA